MLGWTKSLHCWKTAPCRGSRSSRRLQNNFLSPAHIIEGAAIRRTARTQPGQSSQPSAGGGTVVGTAGWWDTGPDSYTYIHTRAAVVTAIVNSFNVRQAFLRFRVWWEWVPSAVRPLRISQIFPLPSRWRLLRALSPQGEGARRLRKHLPWP